MGRNYDEDEQGHARELRQREVEALERIAERLAEFIVRFAGAQVGRMSLTIPSQREWYCEYCSTELPNIGTHCYTCGKGIP
jgi:hypothetical protein